MNDDTTPTDTSTDSSPPGVAGGPASENDETGPPTNATFRAVVEDRFERGDTELHPNQWAAIMVTPQPVTIIHGPPGTGKSTVGGLSVAQELATSPRPRRVLLTGPTTRAVREVYGDFIEAWGRVAPRLPPRPEGSKMVRTRLLTQPDCRPFEAPLASPYIDHDEVNYRNGATAQTLHNTLTASGLVHPTVVAGTPGKVDRFVDEMPGAASRTRWDTVVCDEASMIDAGELALATGGLAPFDYDGTSGSDDAGDPATGRLYLAGDHRQLPVIRKAEWGAIRRPGTEHHQPQAPALDLIRYLYGQEVEFTTPVASDGGDQRGLALQDITYIPLEQSFRMHTVIADHLGPVYLRDDLEFYSEETATLPARPGPAPSAGLQTALLPGPLTVIIHDDTRGTESNPTEADLAAGIARDLAAMPWARERSVGVVTPHNAQKALLQTVCADTVDTVDTVEGFQGAGVDILLVSLTVASEALQDRRDAWLLDHRRLNVALSRAREKLVVIVPRTLLELRPDELSTYRDAQVLGELVDSVRTAAGDAPDAHHVTTDTTVQEMVGPVLDPRSHGVAGVDVYTHPDTT